jgi:hypothetical protein
LAGWMEKFETGAWNEKPDSDLDIDTPPLPD